MIEIEWQYTGPGRWHYVCGNYVFKKKEIAGNTRYEVWNAEQLKENNLTYWDFM